MIIVVMILTILKLIKRYILLILKENKTDVDVIFVTTTVINRINNYNERKDENKTFADVIVATS